MPTEYFLAHIWMIPLFPLAGAALMLCIGRRLPNSAVNVTGAIFGNPHQVLLQIYGAAFIIAINVVGTFIILRLIGLFVPLRADEETLLIGDDAIHGEEAYAIFADGQKIPVLGD